MRKTTGEKPGYNLNWKLNKTDRQNTINSKVNSTINGKRDQRKGHEQTGPRAANKRQTDKENPEETKEQN